MKRIVYLLCCILLSVALFSTTANAAYDPTNSGIKYHELQKYFFVNSDKITEVPTEVQEAWDEIGVSLMNLFETERTTIYYTSGVSPETRKDSDGNYFNGRYVDASTVIYTGKYKSYGYAERPGRIYLYSDVKSSDTVIHEYGHALYDIYQYRVGYKNGFADTWAEIYEANKDSLSKYDTMAKNNVLVNEYEGFAEAFRIFKNDSEYLSNNNRRVYSFMFDTINEASKFRFSKNK